MNVLYTIPLKEKFRHSIRARHDCLVLGVCWNQAVKSKPGVLRFLTEPGMRLILGICPNHLLLKLKTW